MNAVYDITGKRELMIDDFLLETKRSVNFKQHTPVELPSDPGKPVGHYNTLLQKPDGSFLYYFRGTHDLYKGETFNNHPGEFVGIAESRDGLKWHMPDLRLFPGEPVPCNALFFGKEIITHNFAPFYDTHPDCAPCERYKAVAGVRETNGLFGYVSEDAKKWRLIRETPLILYEPHKTGGHMLDSLNVPFYSETEKCYVMYIRVWKTADGMERIRSFAKVTSPDFLHWSAPEFLKVNCKNEHLYACGLLPYRRAPQYYVGAATRYFGARGSASDNVLLFSRNGRGIIRPSLEAWIRPGSDPSRWLNRMNYITWGILQETPETMIFYHNCKRLMFRLRTDGFVSLNAGFRQGSFLTRCLKCRKGEPEFNLSTSAGGSFQLEVCNEEGTPCPGYSFADMEPFYGDSIAFVPTWKGKTFSQLSAGTFRLRVRMKECDLYSLAFQ